MSTSKTTTVARINEVEILVIENGEKRVAIKPICEVLGVDFSAQLQKLKSDPILGSTMGLITTVGADGKEREMQTIPFKYVFGWLFRIDSRNVKEESREAVLKYQLLCYDVLFSHFTAYADFVEQKQKVIDEKLLVYDDASDNFATAKDKMNSARKDLRLASSMTFDDYDKERRQLKMFSDDEMKGENKNE